MGRIMGAVSQLFTQDEWTFVEIKEPPSLETGFQGDSGKLNASNLRQNKTQGAYLDMQ